MMAVMASVQKLLLWCYMRCPDCKTDEPFVALAYSPLAAVRAKFIDRYPERLAGGTQLAVWTEQDKAGTAPALVDPFQVLLWSKRAHLLIFHA